MQHRTFNDTFQNIPVTFRYVQRTNPSRKFYTNACMPVIALPSINAWMSDWPSNGKLAKGPTVLSCIEEAYRRFE